MSKRPFDIVAEAEQAGASTDARRAEKLYKEAITAYRRAEPSGLDFALGRYGAFLLDQARPDDAAGVFEEAIGLKTDIPAIWSDYIRLVADRRDAGQFGAAIQRMAATVKYPVQAEFILAHARRADREGQPTFAEAVARFAVDRATGERDTDGRWAAIGDLGRIIEGAGRVDEANALWRAAFDEGSNDPETATRLSMSLERSKDYAGAVSVVKVGLNRGLPANVDETLRKRLARCEGKLAGRAAQKTTKRSQTPAYSVRRDTGAFAPAFQIRLKPAVKDMELVGRAARCLLSSKNESTLVDIDLATGSELRRVEGLPVLGDTWFSPDGRGLGIRRTAAIGKGPTMLRFLDAEGRVTAESSVPDATSEISFGGDQWYIGCRNGWLYAFDRDGRQRWFWETPGSGNFDGSASFRPCPYYVAASESFAVAASMGNVYAVSPSGRTVWQAALPNERQTRWDFTVGGGGGHDVHEAYAALGLKEGARPDDVKAAYRRMALATHPDRNPDDHEATAKFCQVQAAYETVLAGRDAAPAGSLGATISFEIHGLGPTASFIAANSAGVAVGSSQGRLYVYDQGGSLREARVLGDGPVRAALRSNGTVGAAWCGDALLFMKGNNVVNATEAIDWPRALTMLGEDVVLWRGNDVQILDAAGRVLWAAEFSRTVTAVAAHGETLLCAAGVLAAFKRAS